MQKIPKILLLGSPFLVIDSILYASQIEPWQLGFQKPATEHMANVISFHDYLLMPIITGITLFVLFLIGYVCFRFNKNRNPVPSNTTHNTLVEILWTVIPVIILIVIAIPSFRLLYTVERIPESDITIKATGNQWYWTYEYPDYGNFSFDSIMLEDEELGKDDYRLLSADTSIVVPVGKVIKILITSNDVLHAWAIPAFGIKMDAIPGKINETWFKAEYEGKFYGQCSELCGIRHAFMPINVEVVSEEKFKSWVELSQEKYALNYEIEDIANQLALNIN